METLNNNYDGKPIAYLDHNILDVFVKNKDLPFASELRGKYQIVYSDETLKEIKRTGDGGSKFLEVLEDLEAMHLRIFITESFKVTDKAILKKQTHSMHLKITAKTLNRFMKRWKKPRHNHYLNSMVAE